MTIPSTSMAETPWKPDRAEAQFLGELLNIDAGLAGIARNSLAKGVPLREVVANFKSALAIAQAVRELGK